MLNLTKLFSDYNFFKSTVPGIAFSILLASIPEAISTMYLFASLFASRSGEISSYGLIIGGIVAYVIYVEWAYGLAVQGNPFWSFVGTLFGAAIAFGGWYIAFLNTDTNILSTTTHELNIARWAISSFFVFGNAVLLCVLNHKIYIKTDGLSTHAIKEEKELSQELRILREDNLKKFINSIKNRPEKKQRKYKPERDNVRQMELNLNKKQA